MTAAIPPLAPWVSTRAEPCRASRTITYAVNHRDARALLLGDPDESLIHGLEAGGFLADSPPLVAASTGSRVVRFLRSFDVRWAGADRAVVAVHDRLAHRFWQRRWLVAQAGLALAGVVALVAALTSGRTLELRPSGWHLPVYVALSLVAVTVHELGHGVVLSHHRRKVSSVGFRLHLGSPAFYVESVEAFLLTRRQRLLQAGAGIWAEWQLISLTALALWVLPASGFTPVLHRFVLLSGFTALTNLLPFAGLDGSLLFADLVREPNLSADAKQALVRVRHDRRRGDGFLVTYALVNGLVSSALLVSSFGLWYLVFGTLVRSLAHHGPLGLIAAALVVAVSFGPSLAAAARWLRRFVSVDRLVFRLERRRRVDAAERFAVHPSFGGFDVAALGVLAGQLELGRASRSAPLHDDAFTGWLAINRPAVVRDAAGERTVDAGVHEVRGRGIAVEPARRFSRVSVARLSTWSLEVVEHFAAAATAGR